jgi:hypothetical protein
VIDFEVLDRIPISFDRNALYMLVLSHFRVDIG